MAFRFIHESSTGAFQTLFNRLIEDPEIIDLTDTPGALSVQSIPMDGVDESLTFKNIILVEGVGVSGASAENIAVDAFIKRNSSTAASRSTYYDQAIMRGSSGETSGFDGFYICSVVYTGSPSAHYVEFRVNHDQVFDYVLTGEKAITTTAWHHVMCMYASGEQKMYIMQDMSNTSLSSMVASSLTEVLTGTPLGERGINWGGVLDEVRLWIATGSASSVGRLSSVTAIGSAPEDLSPPLNDFKPSADTLAAWWRFETISAIQLFSGIAGSVIDSTAYNNSGTPSGFEGSDIISSETTIINGLSASGDLKNLLGGTLDHGGLCAVDPSDGTLLLEMGSENLIKDEFNTWTASGTGVIITNENYNIFYGASGVKVNTISADTGIYQTISNSALLFNGNHYTTSFRYRSVSGSTSARVTFTLGTSAVSVTATTYTDNWWPIITKNSLSAYSISASPSSVPNLVVWLDSSDFSTIQQDVTGGVSGWVSKGEIALTATQTDGTKRPKYIANGGVAMNSLPVLRHTITGGAVGAFMSLGNISSTLGAVYAYIVTAKTVDQGTVQWQRGLSTSDGVTGADSTSPNFAILPPLNSTAGGSFGNSISHTATVSTNLSTGNKKILNLGFGRNMYGTSQYFGGDISEIVIYNRALTTFEHQRVQKYLVDKYNGARLNKTTYGTSFTGDSLSCSADPLTCTGRVDIIQLNSSNNAGALFHIDGLQVVEGSHETSFIGPSRTRKSGQLFWPVLD